MSNIGYFKCCENIDWSLFVLDKIADEEINKKPRSPIEILVDDATGFQAAKDIETIKAILYHLNRIVRYKRKIKKYFGIDHPIKDTLKSIRELKSLLKTLENNQPKVNH